MVIYISCELSRPEGGDECACVCASLYIYLYVLGQLHEIKMKNPMLRLLILLYIAVFIPVTY